MKMNSSKPSRMAEPTGETPRAIIPSKEEKAPAPVNRLIRFLSGTFWLVATAVWLDFAFSHFSRIPTLVMAVFGATLAMAAGRNFSKRSRRAYVIQDAILSVGSIVWFLTAKSMAEAPSESWGIPTSNLIGMLLLLALAGAIFHLSAREIVIFTFDAGIVRSGVLAGILIFTLNGIIGLIPANPPTDYRPPWILRHKDIVAIVIPVLTAVMMNHMKFITGFFMKLVSPVWLKIKNRYDQPPLIRRKY